MLRKNTSKTTNTVAETIGFDIEVTKPVTSEAKANKHVSSSDESLDADAKQYRQSAGSGSDASNVSSSSSTSSAGPLKPDVVADVVSVDDVAVPPPEPIPVVGLPVRKVGLLRVVCMGEMMELRICFQGT